MNPLVATHILSFTSLKGPSLAHAPIDQFQLE